MNEEPDHMDDDDDDDIVVVELLVDWCKQEGYPVRRHNFNNIWFDTVEPWKAQITTNNFNNWLISAQSCVMEGGQRANQTVLKLDLHHPNSFDKLQEWLESIKDRLKV